LNKLRGNKIFVGQRLLIKKGVEGKGRIEKEDERKKEISPRGSEVAEEIIYHQVKRGESLSEIARKYGVSLKDLREWNNLRGDKILIGQRLIIKREEVSQERQEKKKSSKARPREIIYRVKKGETLREIARIFGVSEEEIIELNNLKNKSLRPGQRLLIRLPESVKEKSDKEPENLFEAFENIKKDEEFLRRKGLDRRDYLKLISRYRHLYLLYPSSEVAPYSLLKSAELYYELYHKSLRKSDALEAAKRFELFLKAYPNHSLKERAYLSLLEIYERELKDFSRAEEIKRKWGNQIAKEKLSEAKLAKKEKREESAKEISTQKEKGPLNKTAEVPERKERPLEIRPDLKRVVNVEPVTGEDYTRVIVDLSGEFKYSINILPENKDKPPRLYVDIYPALLDGKVQRIIDLKDKHLKAVRVGQFDSQTVRVVLDLNSLTDYKVFKLGNPYQLIIDLVGKEKRLLAKTEMKKPIVTENNKPKDKPKDYINLARQLGLGVKRIMLDPGHGGEDPGALGPNGLKEKDVVLKLAHLIGNKLESRLGVEVLYTRTNDVFIPLAKRPALANSKKADLFISLHLNASPDPKAKGIEVYYLNFTTDPEAMRVAALENRANNQGLAELQDLVKAVLANTKLNESRELATKIQRELVRHLSKYYPDVEDRGVKYAPFLVLVGTRMPAVLIEVDFITNPEIAKRFTDGEYLENIAEGIVKGIEAYIQSLKLSLNTF